MSQWISVAQPPLRDLPVGIQYGDGLLDDPVDFARNQIFNLAKSAASYYAQRLVSGHQTVKAAIAVGLGPLIDIAVGHYPEIEAKKKREKKRKEA